MIFPEAIAMKLWKGKTSKHVSANDLVFWLFSIDQLHLELFICKKRLSLSNFSRNVIRHILHQ
jgi:hypothetical protein